MSFSQSLYLKTLEALETYWLLVRLTVSVSIAVQVLQEVGAIEALSPLLGPVMNLLGLPPELAFSWLTALLIGIWGGIVIAFTLVSPSDLTVADMTVLSTLMLVAHAIPIEQRIIQQAGPNFWTTSALRIGGALILALTLHYIFAVTGWLSTPLHNSWITVEHAPGWSGFAYGMLQMLAVMFGTLIAIAYLMEFLKRLGILNFMTSCLTPVFRMVGIESQTIPFITVGVLLGITYGGGMLIKESSNANVSQHQIFLACAFMGFVHSIIEDSLLVIALGADAFSIVIGRLCFALVVTALIAKFAGRISQSNRPSERRPL